MPDRENRDRAVERLLPQVLGGVSSTDCVDGETLAAWTDGRLMQSDAARLERHVADCARCQTVLGTLVRISPPSPPHELLWQRWRLGWLLPLATAAAAVALWAIIPETRMRPDSQVSLAEPRRDTPAATAPPLSPPEAAAPPPASAAPAREATPLAAPAPVEADRFAAKRRDADDSRRQSVDTLAKLQSRTKPLADEERQRRNENATTLAERPGTKERETASRIPPVPAAPAQTLPPAAPSPVAGPTADVGRRAAQAVASNATLARPTPAAETTAASAPAFKATIALQEVATPVASTRWRIVDGARIERTTDNGARWTPVPLPDAAAGRLTAAAAPSADVCWIVGRSGRVYLTIDGERFTRLAFPEIVDLMSVRATDARTAIVTAADGRSFQTSDAGTTWR